MRTILKATDVTKEMGEASRNHILKKVNVEILEGEFISVMGPSGSGKSTLLYNISGMDKLTAGSVVLDGKELIVFLKVNWPKYVYTKWALFFNKFIF